MARVFRNHVGHNFGILRLHGWGCLGSFCGKLRVLSPVSFGVASFAWASVSPAILTDPQVPFRCCRLVCSYMGEIVRCQYMSAAFGCTPLWKVKSIGTSIGTEDLHHVSTAILRVS